MADELQEAHAPKNMRDAYRQLQQLYGEENIPLILGTEMHGGKTDMVRIEVGKDQMMLCLLENYHEVPEEYRDSAPFCFRSRIWTYYRPSRKRCRLLDRRYARITCGSLSERSVAQLCFRYSRQLDSYYGYRSPSKKGKKKPYAVKCWMGGKQVNLFAGVTPKKDS